jgi:alkylation response protein AidB-like acyl-CoA dehydrogenase
MLLALSDEQEFFRETTARFLSEHVPPDALRSLRSDPVGFDPAYWQQGADLGWTSLLVDEKHGGGTISGLGLFDLAVIAYEFGRHAAPGPLVETNLVATTLSEDGAVHASALDELLSGKRTATWCTGDPLPFGGSHTAAPRVDVHPDAVVLNGTFAAVSYAGSADYLLVSGTTGDGMTQVLVPAGSAGLGVHPISTVDLTRRYSRVVLEDVHLPSDHVLGAPGQAADAFMHQFEIALVLDCAEALGAMDTAFAMTLQWTFDRYSFGRPLASYQALKHRMADLKAWLEASHALCEAAVGAVARNDPNAATLASAAKAFIGQYGSELLHECVQMHGGIGLTFEHDLHLYLRRHTVIRALRGTPAQHRLRLARLVANQVVGDQ